MRWHPAQRFGWALPALGKAQDVPVLMKEAEDLYARSIIVDMLCDEFRDQEGLKFIKDSAVTCMSTTLGVRKPERDNAKGLGLLNVPARGRRRGLHRSNRFIKDTCPSSHRHAALATSAAPSRKASAP